MSSNFGQNNAVAFVRRFGEEITYTPKDGTPRTIWAVVTREPVQGINEMQKARSPRLVVQVLTDSTIGTYGGIDFDELNTGGDTLTVATRYGGTAAARPIANVLDSDPGMFRLELR